MKRTPSKILWRSIRFDSAVLLGLLMTIDFAASSWKDGVTPISAPALMLLSAFWAWQAWMRAGDLKEELREMYDDRG